MGKNHKERTVGILGGMGVYATLDFLRQVFNFSPNRETFGNLKIIIDNAISIPKIIRAALYNGPDPKRGIIKSIENCERIGAEFIAIPCNSVHYYYKNITPHINIPWVNMIEVTAREARKYSKNPLILGGLITVEKKLYSEYIPNAKYPSIMENDMIINAIEEIALTETLQEQSRELVRKIILQYKEKADSVILACTELSLVFKNKYMLGLPVIDSNVEYAKEVVKLCLGRSGLKASGT
ncbi:MAG: amino acid racemase [candidate division KSB1 bacterium]|jgi:aspartate racemase|nr:amino acid racemase [candidate division KSB1 bacterium]